MDDVDVCRSFPLLLTDALKRAFDIGVALALLVCLAPLAVVVGVLVYSSSPGPIFFRQQRVGRGERPFWLYKFRSMFVGNAPIFVTTANDPRVTALGFWLRRWKLDELPQLYNVLRGDMSLVGPRPEVPKYVAHYTSGQREVFAVRPGITGVSQLQFRNEEAILAGRSDIEAYYLQKVMPIKLSLDRSYVHNQSFTGDLRLLIQTALVLCKWSSLPPVPPGSRQTDPSDSDDHAATTDRRLA